MIEYLNPIIPFESYKSVCLFSRDDGRKDIILKTHDNKRKDISYLEYLICIKLGRRLNFNEKVISIDGNNRNYTIDNVDVVLTDISGSYDIPLGNQRKHNIRFKPEFPYDQYKNGIIRNIHNNKGINSAKTVRLYKSPLEVESFALSTYIVCVREKRLLNSNEKVRFKDGNYTNYSSENLYIEKVIVISSQEMINSAIHPTGMKFIPEFPFNDYEWGFIRYNKHHTPIVELRNVGQDIAYVFELGKYILGVKYGRRLEKNERVMFLDGDIKNYNINNLEVYKIPGDYNTVVPENPEIGMFFKPEPPFDNYTKGWIGMDHRNRRRLAGFSGSTDNSKNGIRILFARYLCQVKWWREGKGWIPKGYEVDHIDDDSMNDTYLNLEVMTKIENTNKEHRRQRVEKLNRNVSLEYVLVCPICKKKFTDLFNIKTLMRTRHTFLCCSNRCELTYRETIKQLKDSAEKEIWLIENQVLYTFKEIYLVGHHNDTQFYKYCQIMERNLSNILDLDLEGFLGCPILWGDEKYAPIEELNEKKIRKKR